MQEAEIYEKLTGIFNEVFMREDMELTPALTAKDVPGWDSFKQIEIITTCEDMLNIQFNTRDLDKLKNVGDLVSTIKAKTGG